MYERLAVCMWASVSMRRAALCAASVSSWGGTVRNARVLHVACRFAKTSMEQSRATHASRFMQTALIAHRNNRCPENEWHTATIPAAKVLVLIVPDKCAEFANPVCSKTRRAVGARRRRRAAE